MDPAVTIRHLTQRRQAEQARAEALARNIRDHLSEWVDFLVDQGARKVILFGSLARGEFRLDSDVDLAVEGLPSEVYFQAVGELLQRCPCSCDLVRLEEAPEHLRRRILEEGELLHDSG